jgi:3-(3-hydroxy-phenyl)propionate hydroxylase
VSHEGQVSHLGATQALARPGEAPKLLQSYEAARTKVFDSHVRGLTDSLEQMESAPAWIRRKAFSGLGVGVVRSVGIEKLVARKLSGIDAD